MITGRLDELHDHLYYRLLSWRAVRAESSALVCAHQSRHLKHLPEYSSWSAALPPSSDQLASLIVCLSKSFDVLVTLCLYHMPLSSLRAGLLHHEGSLAKGREWMVHPIPLVQKSLREKSDARGRGHGADREASAHAYERFARVSARMGCAWGTETEILVRG